MQVWFGSVRFGLVSEGLVWLTQFSSVLTDRLMSGVAWCGPVWWSVSLECLCLPVLVPVPVLVFGDDEKLSS